MPDREKVINGLQCIIDGTVRCESCGYAIDKHGHHSCQQNCASDAIVLLKEQNWVKCSNRMPEEHDSIFAKLKGTDKWQSAMFEKSSDDVRIVEVFEDGTRRVYHSHTIDGKWDIEKKPMKRTITHWMPNPKLPKEDR